jgi:protein-S-isoprenylcysteine O-methyltransferase Ste14
MAPKRRILPPVYLLAALLAMYALDRFYPLRVWISAPWSYCGVPLIVAGVVLAGLSARAFRTAGTPVIPFTPSTALVTSGFYCYTRNPMYLGMLVLLVGVALLFGSVGALWPVPLFALVIRQRFIVPEERFLEEIFGDSYRIYKERVRRWL